jgi:hypothetical protein
MEGQNTSNSESNLEQKEQCWSFLNTGFQIMLRALIIKLAWYWYKNGHKDQGNRQPQNKSTQLHPFDFLREFQNIHWRKKYFQHTVLEKLVTYMQKTETRSTSFILNKYQLKIDQRS